MPPAYLQVVLHSWTELRDYFETELPSRDWLFRGQACASWDLKTSLERHTPARLPLDQAEDQLLIEFKRRAHTYLAQQLIPEDGATGEWLALMQHFGAPTRLLDVTRSPYVATYFAVEDAAERRCAVWAFNRYGLAGAAGSVVFRESPEEEREVRALYKGRYALPANIPPEFIQGRMSSRLVGDRWRDTRMAMVVPFVPDRLSERLSVQQGEFLVPRDVAQLFMANLRAMPNTREYVQKLLIPATAVVRGTVLARLRRMNIQRASLFPGLEGYAHSFRTILMNEPSAKLDLRRLLRSLSSDRRK